MPDNHLKNITDKQDLLLVVDGNALVHRAWHGMKASITLSKTGEDVRGVYGFLSMLFKVIEESHPTHCVVAFDTPAPTFRHKQYEAYKAQRPSTPQELRNQFSFVRDALNAFNVPIYEIDGYEADDVLGTVATQSKKAGLDCLIWTIDTDILQLVEPGISVLLKDRLLKESDVKERYGGLTPEQVIDYKALRGDSSDNIPGVPGIGDKTAIKLLLEFGDVETLLKNIDEIEPPKIRLELENFREKLGLGKSLVSICKEVPVSIDLQRSRLDQFDSKEFVDFLTGLEFFSLINRFSRMQSGLDLDGDNNDEPIDDESDYCTVEDVKFLDKLGTELASSEQFLFDLVTDNRDPMQAKIIGIGFAIGARIARYVPVSDGLSPGIIFSDISNALKPIFENSQISKIAHNANYGITVLAKHGICVQGLIFDSMIAGLLMNKRDLSIEGLARDVLGEDLPSITNLLGEGKNKKTIGDVDLKEVSRYECIHVDMALRMLSPMTESLKSGDMWDLFTRVEMPLLPVLVSMQQKGITVDVPRLNEMSVELSLKIEEARNTIHSHVGHDFNIGSPKQLSEVLFKELKIQEGSGTKLKRTKTGGYATDASVLEELKDSHPIIEHLIDFRALTKLKSTYVDAIPSLVNSDTNRVHTTYKQTGSVTGRISSKDPNLQNIPIRTELGRGVRKAFKAWKSGWMLCGADYSQIELRVLAHIANDEGLIQAFKRDEDIHSATASLVYNVSLDQVTSDMRRIAKIMNFGVIYGLSAYGMYQQTGLSPDEGGRFIKDYFSKYPGIEEYMETTKEQARRDGYVKTLLGRKRSIPEILSTSHIARGSAEREAINMPIQGTAADIMKIAMIRMHEKMQLMGLKSQMLLQVHDELIFDIPVEEVDALKNLATEVMIGAMDLLVPLKVTIKTGETWGDLE